MALISPRPTSFSNHFQPSSMASFRPTRSRVFERRDEVEVCSREQGFLGSYYAATVIANMGNNYVVEYKNLLENDERTLLRETVMADDVRPPPPEDDRSETKKLKFGLGEVVDAFDNDGWWVGVVTGKRGIFYTVFFETTSDHIAYPVTRLRPHLEWRQGKWSSCKNRASFIKQNPFFSYDATKSILDEKIKQSKRQHEEEDHGESSVNFKKQRLGC